MRQLVLTSMLCALSAQAQTITESFGSGDNQFAIDFVQIGNPGNAADTTGIPNPVGQVNYVYNLGKYEISRDQILKANEGGGLNINLWDMSSYGGNGANRPATGITWLNAVQFVNYLNTSHGFSPAYKFSGGDFVLWDSSDLGYNSNNRFRNSLAKYFLPSRDEWYKAAYGSPSGSWYDFATGSNLAPVAVANGKNQDTAVYNGQGGPADIDDAGGLSAWGTMAQGGNVWEWMESAFDGTNDTAGEYLEQRGGTWLDNYISNSPELYMGVDPGYVDIHIGIRIASVPEPSALSLLAAGLGGLAVIRRRRS